MSSDIHALLSQGLNTLLILTLPFAVVVSVGGIVFAALQAATSIREDASYYTARLVLVLVAGYFLTSTLLSSLVTLSKTCFGG